MLHFSTVCDVVAVQGGGELHQWHQKCAAGDHRHTFKVSVLPHTPPLSHTPGINTNTTELTAAEWDSL